MTQQFQIKKLGHEFSTQMSCQEAGCIHHAKGWFSVLDVTTDDGAWMATWIKDKSGRTFWEWQTPHALDEALRRQASGDITVTEELKAMLQSLPDGMVVFCFPPGQTCFKQHLDREVKFLHRTRLGAREHVRPLDFNEHFNEESYRINRAIERG